VAKRKGSKATPRDSSPAQASGLQRIRISEVSDGEAHCLVRPSGGTRGNKLTNQHMFKLGSEAGVSYYEWVVLDERKEDGAWLLSLTDEKDPDRLQVRWISSGQEASFSLHKVLIAKKIEVVRGYNLVVPCSMTPISPERSALVLHFDKKRVEPVVKRKGRGQTVQGTA